VFARAKKGFQIRQHPVPSPLMPRTSLSPSNAFSPTQMLNINMSCPVFLPELHPDMSHNIPFIHQTRILVRTLPAETQMLSGFKLDYGTSNRAHTIVVFSVKKKLISTLQTRLDICFRGKPLNDCIGVRPSVPDINKGSIDLDLKLQRSIP